VLATEDITLPDGQTLLINAANWTGTGANAFQSFYEADVTNIASTAGDDTKVVLLSVTYNSNTVTTVSDTTLNFALSVTDGDGDTATTSDNLSISLLGTHTGSGYQLNGTTTTGEVFATSAGNDTIAGGTGTGDTPLGDTVDYSNTTGLGVHVDLSITTAQVTGGSGSDTLTGIENLIGSNYADVLIGNSGNNILVGGLGVDTLTGGGGADHFSFKSPSLAEVGDHITDWLSGTDSIDVLLSAFTGLTGTGSVAPADFVQVTNVQDPTTINLGTAHFAYQQSTGQLFYDADGGGSANRVLLAVIDNHTAMTASDVHKV
jgi:Ca2+-binding RTX toxin-like protein